MGRDVSQNDRWWVRLLGASIFLFWALIAHILAIAGLALLVSIYPKPDPSPPLPPSYVVLEESEKKKSPEEEDEEEPEEEVRGQIVETPPTDTPERPEDSDYLAEHDRTVDLETRTLDFEVNPEVVSDIKAEESKFEQQDLFDLQMDKPSTGATIGSERFQPERDGKMASLPSKWQLTNKTGTQDPVPAAHLKSQLSGAPQNDLLYEKVGDRVSLNTREFVYASYLNRIKRLVNYYWKQNVDNLPSSARITRSQYTTKVNVVLTRVGALEHVEVVSPSGSDELDHCVVQAFKMAGPFPNPPEGLIEKDGRVYLPDMDFRVQFRIGRAQYRGIDPRAGVQYPGILKSPR